MRLVVLLLLTIFQISFLKDSKLKYLQFYAPMQIFKSRVKRQTIIKEQTKVNISMDFLKRGSVLYDNIDFFFFYTFWFEPLIKLKTIALLGCNIKFQFENINFWKEVWKILL